MHTFRKMPVAYIGSKKCLRPFFFFWNISGMQFTLWSSFKFPYKYGKEKTSTYKSFSIEYFEQDRIKLFTQKFFGKQESSKK